MHYDQSRVQSPDSSAVRPELKGHRELRSKWRDIQKKKMSIQFLRDSISCARLARRA